MKTFRLFAALLVAALLPAPAFSQDSSEIAALLAKARRGNGIAQYNLGLAYAEGKGVAADPVEAYVWLSLARENGARGRALDSLTGELDRISLELAQRRLTERKAELNSLRPAPAPVRPAPTPVAKQPAPAPKTAPVPENPAPVAPPATDDPADSSELAALRADRERLAGLAAQHEKAARDAEAKVVDLTRTADASKGELTRVRMALTAAQKASATVRPAAPAAPAYPDLSGRVAELETAYTAASTSLAQAQAALAAKPAAPTAPAYPDLRSRVTELETQAATDSSAVAAAKADSERAKREVAALTKAKDDAQAALAARPAAPAAPSYPDLSGRVAELQAQLATVKSATPAAPAYPNLSGKVAELEAALAHMSSEANRAKQDLAAATKAKEEANASLKARPAAPDTAALDQKTRELKAALAELEEARTFGRQVEDTLNKVNDEKSRVAAAAAAELAEARTFGTQVESTLNKVSDQKAALETALRAAEAARDSNAAEFATARAQLAAAKSASPAAPAAPAYPDLSGKVADLESKLAAASAQTTSSRQEVAALTKAKDDAQAALAAKPSAPTYPDLRSRVAELETQVAADSSAAASAKTEAARAKQEVTALTRARDDAQAALAAKPSAPVYPNLSGKVTELEAALAAASAQATNSRQEVAALTKAKDDAQAALAAKPAAPAYPNLSGKVAELESALAAKPAAPAYPDLRSRVTELETRLAADSSAADSAKAEAARAKQEVAALTKTRDDALAARPSAPAYPNLSGKVTELESALAASAQKAAASEQARTEVAKQFDDYKSSTAAAQRERTTLLASVKLLESDKVSLRRQADSAGAETDQLRTQVASLKEQLSAKPAAPSYPNLSAKVTELETALAQAKAAAPAYPDLRGRVTGLEADLTTARQLLAARSAAPAYPDLSAKVAELETALANSTRQVAAAATEADRAKREVAQLNKTIAETPKAAPAPAYPDYTNHVKEITAEVTKLRADHAQLQQSLAAAERKSGDLSAEAARAKQEVAALLKAKDDRPAAPAYPDLRGKVGALETELANLSSAMSVVMSSKTEALAQVGELTKASEEARARTAELQTALAAKPAAPAYPDLSGRVAELESAYTAASTSLAQAQAALATKSAAPAYPDLSGRVKELETQLTQVKAAPATPDLSGRVAELQTALTDAARKLAAADKTQADLRQELAATENASKVKSDYVTELEGKLRKQSATAKADPQLQREHQELTGRVASLSGEVTQLREDRERMQKLIADSGRRQRDATADAARIRDLETQAAASQAALSAAKTEASQASARTAELQTALAAKPAAPAYPDVRNQVTDLRGQLTALSAEAEHGKQQLAASIKAREVSQTQISSLEAQLADATGKQRTPAYPNLTGRVTDLETQLATLSSEANRARQEVAALNKAKEEASRRPAAPAYPDLSGKVAELETRLTRQAADLTAATAAKAAADQQVATLTKAASQPRSEPISAGSPTFPNLSLRVRELEGQLATATADAQHRGQQLADLTKSSETTQRNLTREIEATKAAHAKPAAPTYPDLSGRVAQLERDLTTARGAAPTYPDLSGRVAELENRQARLTADLSAATSAKAVAEQQAAALAAKPSAPAYPDLRSRVTALETQAAADSSAAASAKAEAARAKQELAALAQARQAQPAAPAYPDLRTQVAQLESDLATARNARPAAPAYPDLRNQVTDLRGQLTALTAEDTRTKQQLAALTRAREETRPPAYPDLRSRVAELEGQLAQAASQPAAAPAADDSDLQQRLAETEGRLATALRGYALLEKDRDAAQARSTQASEALAAQVATLTAQVEQLQSSTATQASTTQAAVVAAQAENARLSESLAALQRSTGQAAGDATSARALVQQLQGANAVLAQENYQLKTTLSRSTGGAAPTRPAGTLTPVAATRVHVVASGDSLSALSQRYYGTAGRWQEIYNANSGVLGPNGVLRIGTSLRIP